MHFNFYMNLPDNLRTAIKICKRNYQNTQEDADTHLVISHRHRRAISLEKQVAAAVGQQTVLIPAGDDPEYKCFVGTRLVGSCTNHKFINGARYTVLCISPSIILQDDLTKESFPTTPEQVSRNTLLAWAIVYNKAQGDTLQGRVCLHSLDSRHLSLKHLFVGLSRVTQGELLSISDEVSVHYKAT